MKRTIRLAVVAVLGVLLGAAAVTPARAMRLDAWRGHLEVGYAKLVSDTLAPAGSITAGGGVEYPIAKDWLLGPAVAFNLLGSSTVTRGSVTAGLDYSMFDAALLATWLPRKGPFARVSFGPGVASARSELAVAGGGAGFRDLPVEEVQPEFAIQGTIMSHKPKIVSVGLQLGAKFVPVTQVTWSVYTIQLAVHF